MLPRLDGVPLAEIGEAPKRRSSNRSTRPSWDEDPVRLRDQCSSYRLNWLRTMCWIANKGPAQLVQHSPRDPGFDTRGVGALVRLIRLQVKRRYCRST